MHGELSLAERLLDLIGWIIGITITLVISTTLIVHGLVLPFIPDIVSSIIGWSMIVLVTLGIILALTLHNNES